MGTFGTVLVIVVIVAAVIATASFIGSDSLWGNIGKGSLALDEPALTPGPQPGTAAYDAEAREEIRQLLEAKSARRVARGEPELDIDAELARLTARPPVDAALREEIRQHVEARNARRVRRGESPLDIDAEVERQVRDL